MAAPVTKDDYLSCIDLDRAGLRMLRSNTINPGRQSFASRTHNTIHSYGCAKECTEKFVVKLDTANIQDEAQAQEKTDSRREKTECRRSPTFRTDHQYLCLTWQAGYDQILTRQRANTMIAGKSSKHRRQRCKS